MIRACKKWMFSAFKRFKMSEHTINNLTLLKLSQPLCTKDNGNFHTALRLVVAGEFDQQICGTYVYHASNTCVTSVNRHQANVSGDSSAYMKKLLVDSVR